MIREQYLQQLWELLSPVPEQQRRELMYDYEEHFRLAAENGRTEAEAAHELGDPRPIAKELLLGYRVDQAETEGGSIASVSRAVFAAVSLGFFNLVFVLGPYIALLGVVLALWAVSAALCISSLVVVYEGFYGEALTATQGIFAGMAVLGFGMLFGAGTYALTRGFTKMTLQYLRFNSRVIKGRKR